MGMAIPSLESQQFIESCDCRDYLNKSDRCLDEEMERVCHYLDARRLDKIISVVEKQMIESHMHRLVPYGELRLS